MMITGRLHHAMGAIALLLGANLMSAHAEFTDMGLNLIGVDSGSVDWGDYNNNGRPDILLTGYDSQFNPVTKIYRNNGDGTFLDINAQLPGVSSGRAVWGDFNNDGYPDILIVGNDANFQPIAKVFRNNGDRTFTDINAGLTGVAYGSASWGDYNGDGFLDILLTGYNANFESVAIVYRNNQNGTFLNIGAALTGVSSSSAAWGDFNGDGRQDILLSGWDGSQLVSKVYRFDGGFTFTDIGAGLTGLDYSSVAWADFDGNGKLDILMTGFDDDFNAVTLIYRNNGDGTFTETSAELTGVGDGSVAVADFDRDGRLDILLTGANNNFEPVSLLYRNNGDGTFAAVDAGLTGVSQGSAAWGDFNKNGSPDLLLAGWSGNGPVTKLYRNDHAPADDDDGDDEEEPIDEEPEEPVGPTVTERIESLLDQVHSLAAARRINNGIANAATNQLGNVLRSYGKGNLNAACSQLTGFMNLIQGQINARKLNANDGQALIDAANATKAAIGCS